jgi:hypothetical protein
MYLDQVSFLPNINFEKSREFADTAKENFLKVKLAVFTGSKDDRVIVPYQSVLFGYWNITDSFKEYNMIPMQQQQSI